MQAPEQKKHRLSILDAFRGIAILMVICYHFFSRYIPSRFDGKTLYPYGEAFQSFFSYGYLGVDLFFMISGFVIFYSIEKTGSFKEFVVKRWLRLFPTMLVCSILTFIFCNSLLYFYGSPFTSPIEAFIPSLLFISPDLFHLFSDFPGLVWISGSYWSLWVEVQFYIGVALIFFRYKERFFEVFLLVALSGYLLYDVIFVAKEILISQGISLGRYLSWIIYLFDISKLIKYLPLFSIGMTFYWLSQNRIMTLRLIVLQSVLLVHYAWNIHSVQHLLFIVLFLILFILFLYKPSVLKFIDNKYLVKIGISSYGLYLIHENIGVALIHLYGDKQALFTLFVIITMTLAAYFYFIGEQKIMRKIRNVSGTETRGQKPL